MSIYAHPNIAALWVVSFLLRLALTAIIFHKKSAETPKYFTFYLILTDAKTAILLYCSASNLGMAYSWVFWIGSYLAHLTVAAIAVDLLFRLFWPVKRLPKRLREHWSLTATLLLVAVLVLRLLQREAGNDWETALTTSWDQTATVIVAGMFWLLSFGSDALGIPWRRREYAVGLGFLILYTLGLLTSSLRANLASTSMPWHQALWIIELLAEAAILAYWIRTFRLSAVPTVTPARMQDLARIRVAISSRENQPLPQQEP